MTQEEYLNELANFQKMLTELKGIDKNIKENNRRESYYDPKTWISQYRAGQTMRDDRQTSLSDNNKRLRKKQEVLKEKMELSKNRLKKYRGEI